MFATELGAFGRGIALLLLGLQATTAQAGPPYETDDPEPVDFGHWEFYLATQPRLDHAGLNSTAPHIEINCGALPNLQLHSLLPMTYNRPSHGPAHWGLGDIELGAKLRFVQETSHRPMIGIFPFLELPTGDASKGLGTGHTRAFFPIWLQKGFGPWTSYGGGGYWLNPGSGNRNWWFAGWQVQRRLAEFASLGVEIVHATADRSDGRQDTRLSLGLVVDFSGLHHLLISAGRSVVGDTRVQVYVAYQITL
jgi:hypothetical protein